MRYFSADQHYGHANVLELCKRPFSTIWDHDKRIISNHYSIVTDNDETLNIGDVGFRSSAFHVAECIKKMNGKHVILLGNHDKPLRQAYERGLLKDMLKSGKLEIIGGEMSIQDHTLAIYKMIEIDGQRVFVGHYAVRTWPSAFRGSFHLFGHSHSNMPDLYKSMDIGVDTQTETHQRFFPWSWKEITDHMNAKPDVFSEKEENGIDSDK